MGSDRDASAIPEAQLRLLTDLSTDERPHSGRSLFDHLAGTRALLLQWGNDDDIAAAGLFHSIYGTQAYKIQSVSLDRRSEVADVIGARAEELAYLFCVTDRNGFWTELGRPAPALQDLVHATRVDVSTTALDDLIEIEAANVVEQIAPAANLPAVRRASLRRMVDAGAGHMSPGAAEALGALVEDGARPQQRSPGSSSSQS